MLVDQLLLPGYHPSLRVAALGAICRMLEIIELRQTLYEGKAPARRGTLPGYHPCTCSGHSTRHVCYSGLGTVCYLIITPRG